MRQTTTLKSRLVSLTGAVSQLIHCARLVEAVLSCVQSECLLSHAYKLPTAVPNA